MISAILLTVLAASSVSAEAVMPSIPPTASVPAALQFDANGTFKIVQIADLHTGEGEAESWGPMQDKNSTAVIRSVLQVEKPSLVALSGDQLTGLNIDDNATAYWDEITAELAVHGVPHTAILGNHDAEPFSGSGRNQSSPGARTNRTALMMHDMKDPLSFRSVPPRWWSHTALALLVHTHHPLNLV